MPRWICLLGSCYHQFLDRARSLTNVEAILREASAFVGSLPETDDIVILSEAELRKQAEQQSIMQSEESRLRCLCKMWDVRSKSLASLTLQSTQISWRLSSMYDISMRLQSAPMLKFHLLRGKPASFLYLSPHLSLSL